MENICVGLPVIETEPKLYEQMDRERFYTLSLDMFFVIGVDGYLKQFNPMCQKTLAFTAEQLLTTPFVEFIHPEDRVSTTTRLQKLLAEQQHTTTTFENRYRCRDGSYKWLLWNATLCQQEQLIYAAARDISQRKQAEAALKDSEERFRLLVESVKDYAIYMIDPSGKVISWNKGAEHINGHQAEEIIGQHFSCFFPEEEVELGKPKQVLEIAQLLGNYEYEGQRLRKDGSQFWANVVITPLWNEKSHQLNGFAIVTRDITEQKKAQEALEQAYSDLEKRVVERTSELQAANELLKQEISDRQRTELALRKSKERLRKQANELKQTIIKLQNTQAQLIHAEKMSSLGQLVAGIAHEINNPISFIYGNLKYANQYIEDLMNLLHLYQKHYPQPVSDVQEVIDDIDLHFLQEDIYKIFSSMREGAERIRKIVLALRNFSRHDEAEIKLVNIHEGLDSTLKLLKNRLKHSSEHLAITVVKEYGDLPKVECDAGQLNQVFMNIITNAIDALEEKRILLATQEPLQIEEFQSPTIWIRTEFKDSDRIAIKIIDNGSGMNEEIQRRLFDPFFTRKPVGSGTGLGLSISYQIVVEKHRGQLTCVSTLGKGSEFVIEIPIQQQQQNQNLEMKNIPAAS